MASLWISLWILYHEIRREERVLISVIVIGRNEGERLRACMESVKRALANECYEIIYVDSHSQDDSLALAKGLGARCFVPVTKRTTAALARDIGAKEAKGDVLLFLDGDMQLADGFVQTALARMREAGYDGASGIRHDVYMTAGRVTGENPNYFGCTKERIVPEFGGAIFLSRAALEKAGGWPADVEAGEEAELHARLNRCGARIVELPVPMIKHTDCVQGDRGVMGTIFSRRRLGNGQAFRHAIGAGSAVDYIKREKALFVPYLLDVACVVMLLVGGMMGLFAAAVLACVLLQAAQLFVFYKAGRIRGFVSAKLFFFALPIGMARYHRRDTNYREWMV